MNIFSARVAMSATIAMAAVAAGCQHDIHTPFPGGLTELEDNPIPVQTTGPYPETMTSLTNNIKFVHVYGLGYVQADPASVWAAIQDPAAMVASCTTDDQVVNPDDEPDYEFSFSIDYTVHDFVTVTWTDAWRYGVLDGTPDAPTLALVKHQKIDGSSYITLSEGTIALSPSADDPNVTQLSIVEHLDSLGGSVDTVLKGVQHNFDAMVAVSHGKPVPPCP
jgi:hypothetical protein